MNFGDQSIMLQSVGSTNDFCIQLLKSYKPEEGTLFQTKDQYSGRGQMSSKWIALPGLNFTGTYVIYPKLPSLDQFYYLNKAVSIAVARTINHFLDSDQAVIKWPNDILVEDKKCAGILIQNAIQGKRLSYSILGIGINVNQKSFAGNFSAQSLAGLLGYEIALNDVKQMLNKQLGNLYRTLTLLYFNQIDNLYHQNLLGINKQYIYLDKATGESFGAKTVEVDAMGKIHLDTENSIRTFSFKEVELML